MAVLKIKDENGNFIDIPAIVGPQGPQGIKGDTGPSPDLSNYTTKDELNGLMFINVKALGAIGDGVNDDTTIIQNALNLYKRVYIPGGSYKLTAPLIVKNDCYIKSANDARFISNHDTAFIINGESTDTDIVSYNGYSNITIEGGIWDNNIEERTAQKTGFAFGHAKNITIKDLTILHTIKGHSIEIAGVDGCIIDNVKFIGCIPHETITYWEAIQLELCTDGFAYFGVQDYTPCKNITVKNCLFDKDAASSYFHSGVGNHVATNNIFIENVVIENNTFVGCDYTGVRLYCFNNSIVKGNKFDGCKRGVMLSGSSGTDNNSNDKEGNQTGIPQSCTNILIDGNEFKNAITVDIWGVAYENAGNLALISDVVITNNKSSYGKGCFVYIIKGENIRVENNKAHDITGSVVEIKDISNLSINNNFFDKATLHGITILTSDVGSGLLNNVNITNNIITNMVQNGIRIRSTYKGVIENNIISECSVEGTYNPIFLNNDCKNINVANNVITNTVLKEYGYIKIFGNLCENIDLSNNTFTNYNDMTIENCALRHTFINNTNKPVWEEIVLEAGLTGFSEAPPMLRQIGNQIYLKGGVSGVVASNTLLFTLPSYQRPKTSQYFIVTDSESALKYARIGVHTNGTVTLDYTSDELYYDVTVYRLDPIVFTID